jgi:hypothetical protein
VALLVALDRLRTVPAAPSRRRRACWLIWVSAGVDRLVRNTRIRVATVFRQSRECSALDDARHESSHFRTAQLRIESVRLITLLQDPYLQQSCRRQCTFASCGTRSSTDGAFVCSSREVGSHDPPGMVVIVRRGRRRRGVSNQPRVPPVRDSGFRCQVTSAGRTNNVEELGTGRRQVVKPSRTAREGWEASSFRVQMIIAVTAIDEAADSWFRIPGRSRSGASSC